jgi:hypothetical protein
MATTANARAARERKQKIFVAVGGLVLLALLAIQLPKLLGGPATTTATPETETTIVGETTPAPSPTATPVSLPDTDRPLPVGEDQFRSFSAFDRKDPFVQQIASPDSPSPGSGIDSTDSSSSGGGGGGGGSSGDGDGDGDGKATGPGKPSSQGFTVGGTQQAAVTVIAVNGSRQTLSAGSAFPATDPVFVLIAENVNAKTVVVGVVGGAYANGSRTTKLRIGKPLVLVNTTTGARYRLVLVSVGTGAPVPAAGAPTTPTTTP